MGHLPLASHPLGGPPLAVALCTTWMHDVSDLLWGSPGRETTLTRSRSLLTLSDGYLEVYLTSLLVLFMLESFPNEN